MALRLGLGLGLAGGGPFSPSSLYGSAGGDYWDFSDTSTLFQDTAATSPVTTAAQTIARVNGKLGRYNLTQGTAGQRPAWAALPNDKMGAQFDGTDDGLSVAGFDLSAADEITVIAGVRRTANPAAAAVMLELTADWSANNGTIISSVNGSGTADFGSKGTTLRQPTSPAVASVPSSYVLTGRADISADSVILRINGTDVSQSLLDQGTGNFGNHTLYVGRRGGTTFPWTGFFTSLLIIGRVLTADELAQAEAWTNARMGAY